MTNINNETLIPPVLLSFSSFLCRSVCHFLSVFPWLPLFLLISFPLHTHTFFLTHSLSFEKVSGPCRSAFPQTQLSSM
uniref:Uncharacterized protein n=1 Tax=Lates calcarifer TaxID=8187 RepID=A0A4W6F6D2_LATCA